MTKATDKRKRASALVCGCPKCGAAPGFPCIGVRGERKANHAERRPKSRYDAAIKKANYHPPVKRQGFYWSDEWRAIRYRALVLHGGQCQCCGARPSPGKPLHVDHIKPRSKHPELELELGNLQVLCDDCNIGKGASDQTDWRPTVRRVVA